MTQLTAPNQGFHDQSVLMVRLEGRETVTVPWLQCVFFSEPSWPRLRCVSMEADREPSPKQVTGCIGARRLRHGPARQPALRMKAECRELSHTAWISQKVKVSAESLFNWKYFLRHQEMSVFRMGTMLMLRMLHWKGCFYLRFKLYSQMWIIIKLPSNNFLFPAASVCAAILYHC